MLQTVEFGIARMVAQSLLFLGSPSDDSETISYLPTLLGHYNYSWQLLLTLVSQSELKRRSRVATSLLFLKNLNFEIDQRTWI